jgi:hypothetical protein
MYCHVYKNRRRLYIIPLYVRVLWHFIQKAVTMWNEVLLQFNSTRISEVKDEKFFLSVRVLLISEVLIVSPKLVTAENTIYSRLKWIDYCTCYLGYTVRVFRHRQLGTETSARTGEATPINRRDLIPLTAFLNLTDRRIGRLLWIWIDCGLLDLSWMNEGMDEKSK